MWEYNLITLYCIFGILCPFVVSIKTYFVFSQLGLTSLGESLAVNVYGEVCRNGLAWLG